MDSPRVAVVIPCFNDGATLREAVDSARHQDPPPDVVVIDDGSTEAATLAVMGDLEAEGVRVLHQPNAGLGAARMAGVRATTAPYILPLDADDVLVAGAVQRLAAVLDGDPDLAVAWGWYQRFGDATYVQPTAPRLDAWQISHQNDLPATAMIRRSALERTPGWRLRGGYEDWDLWMTMAELGMKGVGLAEVVYRYRRHGTRMLDAAADRHGERLARLRALHPALFADRRRLWRASSAPLALRVALPLIARLPVPLRTRRLLSGAACHFAHRRGTRALIQRLRAG